MPRHKKITELVGSCQRCGKECEKGALYGFPIAVRGGAWCKKYPDGSGKRHLVKGWKERVRHTVTWGPMEPIGAVMKALRELCEPGEVTDRPMLVGKAASYLVPPEEVPTSSSEHDKAYEACNQALEGLKKQGKVLNGGYNLSLKRPKQEA